jgi:hypothetical protein
MPVLVHLWTLVRSSGHYLDRPTCHWGCARKAIDGPLGHQRIGNRRKDFTMSYSCHHGGRESDNVIASKKVPLLPPTGILSIGMN